MEISSDSVSFLSKSPFFIKTLPCKESGYKECNPISFHKYPTDKDPTDKYPTDEYPTDKDPTDKDPIAEDPTDKDPTDKNPADNDPIDQDPIDKDPTDKNPADKNSIDIDKDPTDKDPTDKNLTDNDLTDNDLTDNDLTDNDLIDKDLTVKDPTDKATGWEITESSAEQESVESENVDEEDCERSEEEKFEKTKSFVDFEVDFSVELNNEEKQEGMFAVIDSGLIVNPLGGCNAFEEFEIVNAKHIALFRGDSVSACSDNNETDSPPNSKPNVKLVANPASLSSYSDIRQSIDDVVIPQKGAVTSGLSSPKKSKKKRMKEKLLSTSKEEKLLRSYISLFSSQCGPPVNVTPDATLAVIESDPGT